MRKSFRTLVTVAGIAAFAAGGSAFTAGNTQAASQVVGYGSTTVSGATVNSMTYNLNGPGDNVNTVTLVLAGDTTGSAVSIGFNGGTVTSCGTGTFTTVTTYTCDNGGSSFVRTTAGLVSTAVVVN
ncbi:MAG: hypothetical protein QOC60_707 [Frankiaceae bacterium]|nr:hypothetical protein [Frankiaceae bacterium]